MVTYTVRLFRKGARAMAYAILNGMKPGHIEKAV